MLLEVPTMTSKHLKKVVFDFNGDYNLVLTTYFADKYFF